MSINWLLTSPEPWTRYRTLVDLLARPESDAEVITAHNEMIQHPNVRGLMAFALTWGEHSLKRHNNASHSLYAISTLADFGLQADDPGMEAIIKKIMAHQSREGAFQSLINIPKAFGGDNTDRWTWIICDTPTLLYSLLAFGLGNRPQVQQAVEHLVNLVGENGWRCVSDPKLSKFHGPGRKTDPCPIANVYALKALSLTAHRDGPAAHAGVEMLLTHWADQTTTKMYLFGVGTDYRKLKYPFIWYNILHVADVLSRYPFVHTDPRFQQMIKDITTQANNDGQYTASSMYRAWKDWSFADKKKPSPWLTLLILRLQKRLSSSNGSQKHRHEPAED